MLPDESHISDEELLLAADDVLSRDRSAAVAKHVSLCGTCRTRKQKLEEALAEFVDFHRRAADPGVRLAGEQRAVLKTQIAALTSLRESWWAVWTSTFSFRGIAAAFAFAFVLVAGYRTWPAILASRPAIRPVPVFFPEPGLTPGAVATADRTAVCGSSQPKTRNVPVSLQRRVFEEYGIPGASPKAYEVDYLITPALGGADDIRNLWPQSYSSAVWNARVKDALEDRLHDLVCDGSVDLVAAQRDIASDWIAAYKKYFHTDSPLETTP